jgi:hypothetical protein
MCGAAQEYQLDGADGTAVVPKRCADASLLCTAPGVNPQGSVMAFARRNVMKFLGGK